MATILAVDDTPYNLDILKNTLEMDGHEVVIAQNGQEGLRMAQETRPDLVLLDIAMPVMDGYEVLRKLRSDRQFAQTPIIMLTANTLDESVAKCLEEGANDYVTKPFSLKVLSARIKAALRDFSSHQKLQQDNLQLQSRSAPEGMPGTLNREAFLDACQQAMQQARIGGKMLAMASIAIDEFGGLQNQLSEPACQNLLKQFSGIVQRNYRNSDLIGHMGQERFVICMPGCRSFQALGVIERFRQSLHDANWDAVKPKLRVSSSIGVVMMSDDFKSPESLIKAANDALQKARARGRDQIVLAPKS